MDYFKDIDDILNSFQKYLSKLPNDGTVVLNKDDQNIQKLETKQLQKIDYSLKDSLVAKIKEVLPIPGEHNIANALAAFSAAQQLEIPETDILKALSKFPGTWRRFEIVQKKPFVLISDYAHHPTEIKATLKAVAEKYKDQRIVCIFQPHQYKRTQLLFNELASSFEKADTVLLLEIYDVVGREDKQAKAEVSSAKLAKAIGSRSTYFKNTEAVKDFLSQNIQENDVVLVMGAGDINNLTEALTNLSTG